MENVSNDDITPFAKADYRGGDQVFGIKRDDRRRHMYIIGKTGVGKSTLIENLVSNDIEAGHGLALLDPHGDSVELILRSIPPHRINDVVYINPSDLDFPVAFNVLEKVDARYRHLVASGIVGVFKKLWAESWGPRLEYLLRNAILALLDYPDSTLLGINRILIDPTYRKKVLSRVQDPVVKTFWEDEFSKYNQAFMVEAIAPIQNKVGQFLSTSLIRNIVGQVKSTIDMRQFMDEGKIVLINLSKGRIGEDASSMLGNMIITKIQLAAMSRVDTPEKDRRDFYLYVDEFQNFSTDSFANILSEARKYRLNLIIAHQYVEQLDEVVSAAVFGNVGTMISFRIGASDAVDVVKEFEPLFTEEDLVNLPKFRFYLKLMINGVASDPFSAIGLPPVSVTYGTEQKVIQASRERYGRSREEVQDKIARWTGVETPAMLEKLERELFEKKAKRVIGNEVDFLSTFHGKHLDEETGELDTEAKDLEDRMEKALTPKPDVEPPKKSYGGKFGGDDDEEMFVVNCNACGVKTKIRFKPDGKRPVLCKECLKEFRRQQSKTEDRKAYQEEMKSQGKEVMDVGSTEVTADSIAKSLGIVKPDYIVEREEKEEADKKGDGEVKTESKPSMVGSTVASRAAALKAKQATTNEQPSTSNEQSATNNEPTRNAKPTVAGGQQATIKEQKDTSNKPAVASKPSTSKSVSTPPNKIFEKKAEPAIVKNSEPKKEEGLSITAALSQGVQGFNGKKQEEKSLDEDIADSLNSLSNDE